MVDLRNEIKSFISENGYAMSITTYDLLEIKMKGLAAKQLIDLNDLQQVHSFLNSYQVKQLCENRQPLIEPVPQEVAKEIDEYFKNSKNSLTSYTPITAYRSSNSKGDAHLYSVLAKRKDGKYSCWTSYNSSLHTMNAGHYGLTKDEAVKVLKDNFFDITDCPETPEQYGMECSKVEINEDKEPEKVVNLAAIRARRGR